MIKIKITHPNGTKQILSLPSGASIAFEEEFKKCSFSDHMFDSDFDEVGMTPKEFDDFINELPWAIIPTSNPGGIEVDAKANQKYLDRAMHYLKARAYVPVKIKRYNGGEFEVCFLVPGMTKVNALEYARLFGRTSVVTDSAIVHSNGRMKSRVNKGVYNSSLNEVKPSSEVKVQMVYVAKMNGVINKFNLYYE